MGINKKEEEEEEEEVIMIENENDGNDIDDLPAQESQIGTKKII